MGLEKNALVWKNQTVSYHILNQELARFHTFFTKLPEISAVRNDFVKVAIFAENRLDWIYALLGSLSAKRTLIPVDFMAPPQDVAYILADARPHWVLYSEKTKDVLEKALSFLPEFYRPLLISFDAKEIMTIVPHTHANLDSVMKEFHPHNEKEALIIYTSGTTGEPKGVVLSYANIFANLDAVCREVPIFTSERPVLALLPFHHIFPLVGAILAPLYVRSTVACSPSLNGADVMETLAFNKVAIMIGVPRFYTQIYRGIKNKIDQSFVGKKLFSLASFFSSPKISQLLFSAVHKKMGGRIEYMVSGGAALDKEVGKGLAALGFEVLEGYGMTETAPMITFPRPGKVKLGTAGEKLPSVQIKIENNEIMVRGANVMRGYYRKDTETKASFENGWFKTGDLGAFDNEGYLTITGRSKELIILSNGKNISPVEIEMKLEHQLHELKMPVKEFAVMAKNDLLHGLFVLDQKIIESHSEDELKKEIYSKLIASYNDAVPSYKQIRSFDVISKSLPRTRLEKLKRHELPSLLQENSANKKEENIESFLQLDFVKNFIEKEVGYSISVQSSFAGEIALDSLSRVSLFAAIKESFSLEINEETLKENDTPFKLAQYLKESATSFKKGEINWKQILNESAPVILPKTWPTFNIAKNILFLLARFYFRLSSQGKENIPEQGPCIIVANHQSFIDGLLLSFYLKNRIMRQCYFYAKAKHISGKCVKFLAATSNIIVVDRELDLKVSIQKMAEVLKKNKNIIIFPEGTRTHDGQLGELKKTFAILAKELEVPILPVQINGAFKALPRGRLFPRFGVPIEINFKSLILPMGKTYEQILDEARTKIEGDFK